MSVKWEKEEGNKGTLTVEVSAETVDAALDEAFKKVVKKVQAPGFRKGKMPRKMFERMYGVESLIMMHLTSSFQKLIPMRWKKQELSRLHNLKLKLMKWKKAKRLYLKHMLH